MTEHELDLKEEKKKAQKFKDYHTYVFVELKSGYFYNGYICSVHDEEFVFMDDEIPSPFPIRFDELKYSLAPSRKKQVRE